MFVRIGRLAVRRARTILVVAVILVGCAVALGMTAFANLQTEGFTDPSAPSAHAEQLIDDRLGGSANLAFLVDAGSEGVEDPGVDEAGTALTQSLKADRDLTEVTSFFDTPSPGLRSEDGQYALVLAHVVDDDEETIVRLRDDYATSEGPLRVTLGGSETVGVDITDQVRKDLALAESIAVPLILVLLLLAFRSLVAALLPLVIGAVAVFGTFAELAILGRITDVSVFSVNLTTALGLGLAVDYALLMVSRFREEVAAGRTTEDAVVRSVATAGRTIAFSGVTVAAALTVLLVFPLYFLRSFAYAGIGVVVVAVLAALLVLPAALALLGPRIERGRLPWGGRGTATSPFWGRVATAVIRRPLLTAAPVVVLLLAAAAAPLLHVQFATPDDRVLRTSTDTRAVGDVLREQFPGNDAGAMQVVVEGAVSEGTVAEYAAELSRLAGVVQVRSSVGTFTGGEQTDGLGTPALSGTDTELLLVGTDVRPDSAQGQGLVGQARALTPPDGSSTLVGGAAARLVDTKHAVGSRLPLAAVLIAAITLVLLFLFTGSLLQPIRALLLNLLSLSATLGLMVLVFQDGWLSGLLGHTARPLDIAMLVLLFCITFGLSMDYEVFVTSRIKELHDGGANLATAVTQGLSRTGRIVTTAAVLLAVNFFAFVTSGVTFIQMFGLGSGVAILIDATLVRVVLVPAAMQLLGPAAWSAPAPLRRLHDRFGLREHGSLPTETSPASDDR